MAEFSLAGPSVYLETTIVGYLTSRPSRDIVVAARQELTRQWWEKERSSYRSFISIHVIDEAQGGIPLRLNSGFEYLSNWRHCNRRRNSSLWPRGFAPPWIFRPGPGWMPFIWPTQYTTNWIIYSPGTVRIWQTPPG